nr:glycosyltransferase 87 family protein [Alteromonas sp. 5E99-2]
MAAAVGIAAVLKHQSKLLALALSLTLISLALISSYFDYETPFSPFWTSVNIALMVTSGLLFLLLIKSVFKKDLSDKSFFTFLLMGLALRAIFIPTPPILEDDLYRYFFDGSIAIHGHNPYNHKPSDAYSKIEKDIVGEVAIEANMQLLYLHDFHLFSRVAYPEIKTIYPLTAQVIFAISAMFDEFNIQVWRCVLIGIEVITLFLLMKLLHLLPVKRTWSLIYWLNPLLITEGVNAAHMDVVLVPFLLLTLIAVHFRHYGVAGICIGLAAGVKVWPVLLVPVIAAYMIRQSKTFVVFLIGFIVTCTLVFLPQILALDTEAGLVKYAQHWQVNSFIFNLIHSAMFDFIYADITARVIVASVVGGTGLFAAWRVLKCTPSLAINDLAHWCLWIALLLFLLSPTGYPWYSFWFFPFLALAMNHRTWPILLLTATLPLYDMRYLIADFQHPILWQWAVVTLTFLPVIVCLLIQNFQKNAPKTQPSLN